MRLAAALAGILFAAGAHGATVALVIDDLGYSRELARRALALPPPVTAAVLPHAPYSGRVVAAANRAGIELLLHLPMQGSEAHAQPGLLRSDMNEAGFRRRIREGLAAVPGAIGLNNHMGSILTADSEAMELLMEELGAASAPLLFLDSRTTPESVAYTAATRAGIAATRRDVFLDHEVDSAAIERQVDYWLAQARATGCALAIAHPHRQTLLVLERRLPQMKGVQRVGLAEYVRRCGHPASPPPQVAAAD